MGVKKDLWTFPQLFQGDCFKVTKVRWITVPMSNDFWRGATEGGRAVVSVLSFGLTNWVNGGVKDLSHECIEILYQCERCGNSQRFTAEINGKNSACFVCGYYEYEYDERGSHIPQSMTVEDAERIYRQVGESYNFFFENCSAWCSSYWSSVTQY